MEEAVSPIIKINMKRGFKSQSVKLMAIQPTESAQTNPINLDSKFFIYAFND